MSHIRLQEIGILLSIAFLSLFFFVLVSLIYNNWELLVSIFLISVVCTLGVGLLVWIPLIVGILMLLGLLVYLIILEVKTSLPMFRGQPVADTSTLLRMGLRPLGNGQQISHYIYQSRRHGASDTQISHRLREHGWSDQEIEQALQQTTPQT